MPAVMPYLVTLLSIVLTVTEAETMQSRLPGGLGVAMSTVELAGATVLCAAPEPTGLTKAACVVVGAHSMDGLRSAIDQTITGRDTRTAAYQLAVQTARQFGADDDTAVNIGLTVDIAVPIAFGLTLGAVRVASVRVGKIRLMEYESVAGARTGGHAIARHVGKTKEELAERLLRTENMHRRPNAVSTFTDLASAEAAISKALFVNKEWIKVWASASPSHNLIVSYNAGKVIGRTLFRGSDVLRDATKVKIILKYETYNGKSYHILTAYPEV